MQQTGFGSVCILRGVSKKTGKRVQAGLPLPSEVSLLDRSGGTHIRASLNELELNPDFQPADFRLPREPEGPR